LPRLLKDKELSGAKDIEKIKADRELAEARLQAKMLKQGSIFSAIKKRKQLP
jgi:hypothetical protein